MSQGLWLLQRHNWINCHFITPFGIVLQNHLWYSNSFHFPCWNKSRKFLVFWCHLHLLHEIFWLTNELHDKINILFNFQCLYWTLLLYYSYKRFYTVTFESIIKWLLNNIWQDLAKELLETFTTTKMAKAFFTNSGSEANDTQV